MALAYVIDGGLSDPPGTGTDLCDGYPAVRAAYARAAEWTDVPVRRLLSWEPDADAEYRQVGAIRRAALVFGVCDVLAERGIRPDVVGGMSLGGLIAAAVAGAVGRRELFEMFAHMRNVPTRSGPPQGIAQLRVPASIELEGFPDGVYLAAEIGLSPDGATRVMLLSGYRDTLQKLADKIADPAVIHIAPNATRAFHSPLQSHVSEFLEPLVGSMEFRAPEVALCGGTEPGTYGTAAEVREMFRRNHTAPISLPLLVESLGKFGTDLTFLIGPAMVDRYLGAVKHTVVHVQSNDHIPAALMSVYESGRASARA
jgi:[acyl-carrier-protein] S-malonyltransferase